MSAPAAQTIEVAFSPDSGGEALVVKILLAAKSSIRLADYSSLIDAKRRGTDVAVLMNYENNQQEARNIAPRQALNLFANVGIPARTDCHVSTHHNQYIVIDGRHVETGNFNYSVSAAKRNSESVQIVWNHPQVAKQRISHGQNRWQRGPRCQFHVTDGTER